MEHRIPGLPLVRLGDKRVAEAGIHLAVAAVPDNRAAGLDIRVVAVDNPAAVADNLAAQDNHPAVEEDIRQAVGDIQIDLEHRNNSYIFEVFF